MNTGVLTSTYLGIATESFGNSEFPTYILHLSSARDRSAARTRRKVTKISVLDLYSDNLLLSEISSQSNSIIEDYLS